MDQKKRFSRRICGLFIAAILAFILYCVLNCTGLDRQNRYEQIASSALGIVGGALLVGALYTSGSMAKIKTFKKRLQGQNREADGEGENGKGEGRSRGIFTILCILLFAMGIVFGIAAARGRASACPTAISCLCAATVIALRRKRET